MPWSKLPGTDDGAITLTTSVGASNTFCTIAEKILIEFNEFHPALNGRTTSTNPWTSLRREIPIYQVKDRIAATIRRSLGSWAL